jgi:hypothetical protein
MSDPTPLRCATHPDVETNLRCGKCGKLICPRCLVQTPVGSRCRDCARLYKLPTYRVSTAYYLRAAGMVLAAAVILGLVWGFISRFLPFIYINLLIAAGIGFAIGEVEGLAVNRKRGTGLAVIGGFGVAVCYAVNILTFGNIPGFDVWLIIDIAGLAIGIYTAVNRLK